MKPQLLIDRTKTPDGKELVLYERDGVFTIRVNGLELMSSRAHGSEEAMADLVLAEVSTRPPARSGRRARDGLHPASRARSGLLFEPGHRRRTAARDRPLESRSSGRSGGSPLDDARVDAGRRRRRQGHGVCTPMTSTQSSSMSTTARPPSPTGATLGSISPMASPRSNGVSAGVGSSGSGPRRPIKNTNGPSNWPAFVSRVETVPARRGAKGPKHTIFVARS